MEKIDIEHARDFWVENGVPILAFFLLGWRELVEFEIGEIVANAVAPVISGERRARDLRRWPCVGVRRLVALQWSRGTGSSGTNARLGTGRGGSWWTWVAACSSTFLLFRNWYIRTTGRL
jgi:hypothetical protein